MSISVRKRHLHQKPTTKKNRSGRSTRRGGTCYSYCHLPMTDATRKWFYYPGIPITAAISYNILNNTVTVDITYGQQITIQKNKIWHTIGGVSISRFINFDDKYRLWEISIGQENFDEILTNWNIPFKYPFLPKK